MNPLETITGHSNISVQQIDGTTVEVRVTQIPVEMWPKAIDVALDEARFVELVCNQPRGWADKLPPKSRTIVAEEAERVNEDFFASLARRARMVNRLAPGYIARAAAGA